MDLNGAINKSSKKILLVDDDPVILEMLQTGLENEGYDITPVNSGKEALKDLYESKHDLIVTDLRMEPVGGIQLLKEAKELCEGLTGVIIITGHADMNAAIEALRLGADDFITKPAKLEEICWRVEKFLVQQQDGIRAHARFLKRNRPCLDNSITWVALSLKFCENTLMLTYAWVV